MGLLAVMLVAVGLAATLRGGDSAGASKPPPGDSGDAGTGHRGRHHNNPGPARRRRLAVSVAAVGDTVMGSLPYGLPADGGASFFRQVRSLLARRRRAGQPGGTLSPAAARSAARAAQLLRVPDAAVVRAVAGARLHGDEPGQQPRQRLRARWGAQTVAALSRVGIRNTGRPGRDARSGAGQKVAMLGFAPYTWADSLTDIPARAARWAGRARRRDGDRRWSTPAPRGARKTHVPSGDRDLPRREPRRPGPSPTP